jgi:L-alanine-DL-glutamate epimerase-like enolase superfamily enzyme
MARTLTVRRTAWPLRQAFTISRGSRTAAETLVAEIRDGEALGRGECVPYRRYGESLETVEAQIEETRAAIEAGIDRAALQDALPAGAARNALDCALWDLEAKATGTPVWRLAGLAEPGPVVTCYTISLDTEDKMAADAAEAAARGLPMLKLKLTGAGDIGRVRAVRAAAPGARLVVDANEAWQPEEVVSFTPVFRELGVEMIEQPLPAGADDGLDAVGSAVPLCADESCHDRSSLPALAGKYALVNIKLDKTGGLTEALALRAAAEAAGFAIMVGCMMGSSLAMAPALLVAQGAQVVDLDGPLWLAEDAQPAMRVDGGRLFPAERALWG